MSKRIFSGIQPTHHLHLGNYLGAVRNWVKLQAEFECIFCVVDLHALTVPQDPAALLRATREVAATYIAAGIDPDKNILFNQSAVPTHATLGWLLGCVTPLGWLNRMTQFKEKAGKQKDMAGLGLYSYPVLMAADILLYHATHVPVGEDQKQHLELARDIAGAFNRQFGTEFFPLPEPQIFGTATRVMSLRDGTKKMSKSDESDYSRLNVTDDADTIALKVKKAKTDLLLLPESVEKLEGRPEAANLLNIFAALSDKPLAEVVADYADKDFSSFKRDLSDLTVAVMGPMSVRLNHLMADPAELDRILARGAERAQAIATPVLEKTYDLMGLLRPKAL